MSKTIRIGNASGFWGDDPTAIKRQLEGNTLDYLNADYLAEVSMSILRKQQNRNPELGYVQDFIDHVMVAGDQLLHSTTRIITNAGGNNPVGCAIRLMQELAKRNIKKKVLAVMGDNIVHRLEELLDKDVGFENIEDGRPFSEIAGKVQSANVYIGSQPVVEALKNGADIVVAGRISDSALTIAPLVYEFGWAWDDWDKLAAAMTAGHIIECGVQATGGNFTDWENVGGWENMAFPIIEAQDDGSFIVTKHDWGGGLVSEFTVKEQLVYEIADPRFYYGPDVVADVSSVKVQEVGKNRVQVDGAKGNPAPATLKVSMAYEAGFKAAGSLIVSGPAALEKAEVFERAFWGRLGMDFEKKAVNFIGYNACHQDMAAEIEPNEILVQFIAFDHDKNKLDFFARMLSAMILSGPPGVAVTGGRPKIQEVLRYWPALVPREDIDVEIIGFNNQGNPRTIQKYTALPQGEVQAKRGVPKSDIYKNDQAKAWGKHARTVPLKAICLARSGDKGNTVNIGVLARNEAVYGFIKIALTASLVKSWFSGLCKGNVARYEMDNLLALNFVLEKALDGGGTYSGRIDPQGKTFASALLGIALDVPVEILDTLKVPKAN